MKKSLFTLFNFFIHWAWLTGWCRWRFALLGEFTEVFCNASWHNNHFHSITSKPYWLHVARESQGKLHTLPHCPFSQPCHIAQRGLSHCMFIAQRGLSHCMFIAQRGLSHCMFIAQRGLSHCMLSLKEACHTTCLSLKEACHTACLSLKEACHTTCLSLNYFEQQNCWLSKSKLYYTIYTLQYYTQKMSEKYLSGISTM